MAFNLPYPFARRFGLNLVPRTSAQGVARQLFRVSPPFSRGKGTVEPTKMFGVNASNVRVDEGGYGAARVLSRSGAFGAFGAFGNVLVSDLQFANGDAYRDFLQGLASCSGCDGRSGCWKGYPADRLQLVNDRLTALKSSSSGSALTWVTNWETAARALIGQVDQYQKFDMGFCIGCCGRSDAREAQFKNALRSLEGHLNKVLSVPVPKEPPEPTFDEEVLVDDAPITAKPKPSAKQLVKPTAATKIQETTAGGTTARGSAPSKWLLYGLGALVLAGGAYVVLKK